jgi:small subunit ribosomal protein S16
MIKLRLRRMGAKKRPHYRIVAAEHSNARDGRFIESIGHYNPITDPPEIKVDLERARHWISVGAKPSDTVAALIRRAEAAQAETPAGVPAATAQAEA